MRVNVQLIDAQTGNHLWAERFEKPATNLFDMQDEIVARIANSLHAQLIAAEARRADRAPTPDSMDLYFQGRAWVNKGITSDHMAKARGFLERGLALDPMNVEAMVGIGTVDVNVAIGFFTDDRAARFEFGGSSCDRSAFLGSGACARPPLQGNGPRLHQPR